MINQVLFQALRNRKNEMEVEMILTRTLFDGDMVKVSRRLMIGLSFFICLFFAIGCSQQPEDPAWYQSTTSGDTLESKELITKINDVNSLFDLYEMRQEYVLRGGDSSDIMMELDRRRDQLVESAETFPAIPGKLDFLGWNIQWAGVDPDRQGSEDTEKYRISGYFVVTGKMDRDWIWKIMTKVDEKDASVLPPDRQKCRYVNWQVHPKTSTWEPGEHHVVSTVMELKPVPYYIFATMFIYPELINHGAFDYGWFVDPDLPPVPKDKPAPHLFSQKSAGKPAPQ